MLVRTLSNWTSHTLREMVWLRKLWQNLNIPTKTHLWADLVLSTRSWPGASLSFVTHSVCTGLVDICHRHGLWQKQDHQEFPLNKGRPAIMTKCPHTWRTWVTVASSASSSSSLLSGRLRKILSNRITPDSPKQTIQSGAPLPLILPQIT